ncbi:hypothetical protein [Bacillus massiliigorillae]|uniref:hypothetical protein n=1 Tax=Bacillus massiliigorillae TaxID=1243664 RepID=UPI0003A8FA8D|nr:hypothetical protein [Bacillus massiliigorillae]
MKFIKVLAVIVIVLAGIGYGVYYFGTNMASEKVMDAVSKELENSGQIEAVKKEIEKDPDLKKMVKEGANVDESKLPFTTKEEATRVLVRKVGISKLNNIKEQVQNGTASKEEIMNQVQDKLTDEEILALKVLAYKELNK